MCSSPNSARLRFQSTRPVRGGTRGDWRRAGRARYFNPPAPCGAGRPGRRPAQTQGHFNPPAPCGAGPLALDGREILHISIHPPRAGRDGVGGGVGALGVISIHPPRAGRDEKERKLPASAYISIHPPRAGRDGFSQQEGKELTQFQSTRPVRGGTSRLPRARHLQTISIHPPRAGRDPFRWSPCGWSQYFNPPAPCGAGRRRPSTSPNASYFNPPAPCGAGRSSRVRVRRGATFQSTRPVRGGTADAIVEDPDIKISIHPPRAGRDVNPTAFSLFVPSFQSTRPVRGGTPPWST